MLITRYDMWVEDGNNKSATYLFLIDESTGQPFESGMPGAANHFIATWYFPPTNANDPPNNNSPSYTNYFGNPNRVTGGNINFLLRRGRYHFEARVPPCPTGSTVGCRAVVEVEGSYQDQTPAQYSADIKRIAGGLRVKRITDADALHPARPQVRRYRYESTLIDAGGQSRAISNGILMAPPAFKKISTLPSDGAIGEACNTLVLGSNSFAALSAGAKGSTVGYTRVDVLEGEEGEGGKTCYAYHCLEDRRVEYGDRQANLPTRSNDLNGYLLRKETYRKEGADFLLVAKTDNEYEVKNQHDLAGIYRGLEYRFSVHYGPIRLMYYYPIPVRWVSLASTTVTTYNSQDVSKYHQTATAYRYNPINLLVNQTETTRSDGSTEVVTSTYPADYTSSTSGALAAMRTAAVYQHSAVVESLTRVYQPGQTLADATTVGGSFTDYDRLSASSKYLPVGLRALELARPTANLGPAAPSLPPAGRYALTTQLSYEPGTANLQQTQKPQGLPTSYLWGYENTLPLASVQNASVGQVNAALSALGTSRAAVGALTDQMQLRAVFGQLRTRLPQARIISFTHDPLVGMTSQTDSSGRTITYEYDALGRLLRTRDEQGRLLSQQQYHYARP